MFSLDRSYNHQLQAQIIVNANEFFKSFCLFRPTVGHMTCESFIRDTAEKKYFL